MESKTKTSLILSPQQLLSNDDILQVQHLVKTAHAFDYALHELTIREINDCFPALPKLAKEILVSFNKLHSGKRHTEILNRYKAGKGGIAFETFYENALLRELQLLFEQLKPFASLVKWQHRLMINKSNTKTAPCVFSTYKPLLQFEVVKENNALQLKTWVVLNGTPFNLESFTRYHFLLLSGSEYFLLSHKDFKTLEWLQQIDPTKYSGDADAMAQHILAKLEEDYTVNRNNLFNQNIIDSLPVNRILLSEISGSFLVLTPQWVYDGFVVEGPWQPVYDISKAGEAYSIQRNKEAEQQFLQELKSMHPNFAKQLNGYYYLSFADAQKKQWFLKAYHHLLEQNIPLIGMDMLQHFRYSSHKAATTFNIIQDSNNKLTVEFELKFGDETVGLQDLQKTLLASQKAILLKDGSLGVLGGDWMEQYGMIIKHGSIINKNTITVARWMTLTEGDTAEASVVLKPVIKNEWWQKWQQWQQPDTILYPVPVSVNAILRPYQQKGFEWMALLAEAGAGTCLADDMGLGKTLQTICFLAHYQQQYPGQKHLIVCPSSLLYNWQQEFEKFAPSLSTFIHHGPGRDIKNIEDDTHHIILTTYNTLRSDIDAMAGIPFGIAVIDESHNIKNPSALITKAVNQLNAASRVALSGTPVMNNTFDLYAQLSFLLPGMFGSREFFKREYADAIDRDQDPEKIAALKKLTAPFVLRRTKEQVATDLPEKVESILWCEMGADQKAAYETIKENIRSSVFIEIKAKGLGSGKLSVINGLLKLRQACNSCELVKDEEVFTYDSIKTEILIEELQNIIPGHKALVFSQFTSMLDLLERDFTKNNIPYCRLDGSTPVDQRQELVNNFQQPDNVAKVFLISLKAGNAGLNLTAADYVFLFDPWWNTAVQQQAIDRTHRIGQTQTVFAYNMVCKGSIEEKIMQLQQRKKKLADELITEEESFVKGLTEGDIEFLFS
ncbi:MAG: DEAD/DEAH box helicase [Chitinophagaceae bacterium]|nr:DEAD/DEAH box helicase [Chitinophagaceae bacterium]